MTNQHDFGKLYNMNGFDDIELGVAPHVLGATPTPNQNFRALFGVGVGIGAWY